MRQTDRGTPGRTSLRLSLQFAFLYLVLTLCVFVGAYVLSAHEIRDWAYDWMRSDVAALRTIHASDGEDAVVLVINQLGQMNFEQSRVYGLVDADGTIVAGNITRADPGLQTGFVEPGVLGLPPDPEGEVSGYWLSIETVGPFDVVLGTSDHIIFELLESLGISLIIGFVVLAALGGFLGVRVGRLTGDRVEAISKTLDVAGSGDFEARIKRSGAAHDDLGIVEDKINNALTRIDRLVKAQRQISVDIAHDLRSPMQRLRQTLERLVPGQDFDAERARSIQGIDDIVQTFDALLRIAELERGTLSEGFQNVDIRKVLLTLEDLYGPAAHDAGQVLSFDLGGQRLDVLGDERLISQMFANLIDNAIKHCPAGSEIRVTARSANGTVRICVADNGHGIDQAYLERVFDRFYRIDKSRETPGNGLGLAVVRAIAEAHGARVAIEDNQPGVVVVVEFTAQGV